MTRLKELRQSKGWSQLKAAYLLGISLSTLIRWEATGKFPVTAISKIREVYSLTEAEVMALITPSKQREAV